MARGQRPRSPSGRHRAESHRRPRHDGSHRGHIADIWLRGRLTAAYLCWSGAISGGEPASTPDSVLGALRRPRRPSLSAGGYPPALAAYPGVLVGRAVLPLSGLAPDGVYRATRVTPGAGALLPHRCTLTCAAPPGVRRHRRFPFCGTVLRVAPTGCYPAPCPMESGRSSDRSPEGPGTRPPGRLATAFHSTGHWSAGTPGEVCHPRREW